jgi:internalin A
MAVLVIGYTNYQRIERAYEKGRETINLEIRDSKTGDADDKDFNVAELLGLYKDKDEKKFEPINFTKFLIKALLSLTELRAKIIDEQEDDINDRVRESLRSGGFSVADQSRGGFSGSGKGVGERDLVMRDQYGQQASIIEAMILKSAVKEIIQSHYQKVVNHYNTQGNPYDFLVTYAKVKNFEGLWKRYQVNIENIEDITDSFTDKLSIKVGSTTIDIDDSDHKRQIIHILVNFGVKPE